MHRPLARPAGRGQNCQQGGQVKVDDWTEYRWVLEGSTIQKNNDCKTFHCWFLPDLHRLFPETQPNQHVGLLTQEEWFSFGSCRQERQFVIGVRFNRDAGVSENTIAIVSKRPRSGVSAQTWWGGYVGHKRN